MNQTIEYATVAPAEFPVQMTPEAIQAAKEAAAESPEEGDILRISIRGGGCAGLQYGLHFVQKSDVGSEDVLCDWNGLFVVTDGFSANQLKGTVIRYEETLEGAGFRFDNPSAKRTCGCGSSFGA